MDTKQEIEKLNARATEVNTQIVQAKTKKELAEKRVKELLKELGYSPDLTRDEITKIIEECDQTEAQKIKKFREDIEKAEKILGISQEETV